MDKLFILLLLILSACSSETALSRKNEQQRWQENNGKVKVLTTIAMIADLVNEIGNGYVDTISLIKGELDPHSYQLVKGDDEKLKYADLIFYNGLGLEHGPSLQHYLENNPKAFAIGNELQKQHPEAIIYFRGVVDPHIWMDISLWTQTVPYIVEALSSYDPSHAKEYQQNGERIISELQNRHHQIRQKLLNIEDNKRFLVTSHDAFNYFTRAYLATEEEQKNSTWSMRFAAPEGLAPESQLSAVDILSIINHMEKYNISVIFSESNVSKDSIRKIVSAGNEKGLQLRIATTPLYGDAMGPPSSDGDTYPKMIQHDANVIYDNLIQ